MINDQEKLVKDIMRESITIMQDATLGSVLDKMIQQKTNSLVVINEEGKLIGLVNARAVIARVVPDYLEGDVVAAHFADEEMFREEVKKTLDVPVAEFMNSEPRKVRETSSMMEAAVMVLSNAKDQIRVPVVDENDKVVGLLTRTEIKHIIGYYMGIEGALE